MTILGIACEDRGHFSVVTRLVDDVLIQHHDWLPGILDDCRKWIGLHEGETWYKYDRRDVQSLRPIEISGQRVQRHGRIAGEPCKDEANMWRGVLMMYCRAEPRPDIVILVRDLDGYPARRAGAIQVRDGIQWPFAVVIATPQPEIEAWKISGFVPCNNDERGQLIEIRQEISFDPTTESHRLTSHPNDAPTDAKRVLRRLCRADEARESTCLMNHEILRQRGAANGVVSFMVDVEERIVPAFGRARS